MRARLQRVLRRAGLIDPSRYDEARARVRTRAGLELARVAARVDRGLWAGGVHDLGLEHGERDVARVLGFGYELTRLFGEPLALQPEAREAVAHLGALANGIVSIFDRCLDRGAEADAVLSRAALQELSVRRTGSAATPHGAGALVVQLVALYFEDLAQLPFYARHDAVRHRAIEAIVRMYEAERRTTATTRATPQVLRRKTGLPFVVMGLPGWLATETVCPRRARAHVAWLYRCGVFAGWVDDIVDLEADRRAGRPNRLSDARLSTHDVLARLERLGRRLHRDWNHLSAETERSELQAVLGTCLLSWLGGPTAVAIGSAFR